MKKAFTIIELIFVVVIIGIIAAVIIPPPADFEAEKQKAITKHQQSN